MVVIFRILDYILYIYIWTKNSARIEINKFGWSAGHVGYGRACGVLVERNS